MLAVLEVDGTHAKTCHREAVVLWYAAFGSDGVASWLRGIGKSVFGVSNIIKRTPRNPDCRKGSYDAVVQSSEKVALPNVQKTSHVVDLYAIFPS